ncbi:hypothetical protein ABW19_dt0207661 [Dactylella cylindrospora]|nr:hypothetical protein ABW19_dt0207661 [Dactylella cylindrospora]
MASPTSAEFPLWGSLDDMSYDMLIKTMNVPPSPPHTSDGEDSEASPAPSSASPKPEVESPSEDKKDGDKKPAKKRKSWGQELPTPTTNLPPRKRAKTEAEKEQRRIERVLRNRAAAHSSRERKRAEQEALEKRKKEIEVENEEMKTKLARLEFEYQEFQSKYKELEHHYLLAKSHLPAGFIPPSFPKPIEEKVIPSDNITMADVQALSPQSLIQSPSVRSVDDMQTDSPAATTVLNTTQHHAKISDNLLVKSDVLSTEAVDTFWADWTLFGNESALSSREPLGLDFTSSTNASLTDGSLTSSAASTASDALPASSLPDTSYLDSSFDFFGLGKDEKLTEADLEFLGEQSSANNLFGDLAIQGL